MSHFKDYTYAIFNERIPIPDTEEYAITEDGALGKLLNRHIETKGLVREVEAVLSIRPEIALVIGKWLLSKVKEFEKATGVSLDSEIIEK